MTLPIITHPPRDDRQATSPGEIMAQAEQLVFSD
jgi:hypothetical protein